MITLACIGSREVTNHEYREIVELGRQLAERGYIIRSGNAEGSDQGYAEGANKVNPQQVELYLPWKTYEQESICEGNKLYYAWQADKHCTLAAMRHHRQWPKLTQGVRKLMVRNAMIILGADSVHHVDGCIARLNQYIRGGGGTGHGVRICGEYKIPVVDITYCKDVDWVLEAMERRMK